VKKTEKKTNIIGAWAFVAGVVLAIVIGIFASSLTQSTYRGILIAMVIIGIVIGLLNVKTKESSKFLFAALALVIVGYTGGTVVLTLIPKLSEFFSALMILFVPTTIIVALKTVFEASKD
tara:strand:+ start:262 stop:621 length:360 start_codon:yes stop_codon:yes gene_type:complete